MFFNTKINAATLHPKCTGYLWVYKNGSLLKYYNTQTSKYTIADILPPLYVSGGSLGSMFLNPSPRKFYSDFYFYQDDGYYLFATVSGYVVSKFLGGGMAATDEWWLSSGTLTGTYTKQGTASSDLTVSWPADFYQYESSSEAGEYTIYGGSTKKYFGKRSLNCGTGFGSLVEDIGTYINNKGYFTKEIFWPVGTLIIEYNFRSSAWGWVLSIGSDFTGLVYPYWICSTYDGTYTQVWNGTPEELAALPAFLQSETVTPSVSWAAATANIDAYACEVSHFLG